MKISIQNYFRINTLNPCPFDKIINKINDCNLENFQNIVFLMLCFDYLKNSLETVKNLLFLLGPLLIDSLQSEKVGQGFIKLQKV